MVVCPIAGALSDRTTSRFGRRRPWVLGSAVVCGGSLPVLGLQHGILGVALLWITVQAATNALYAALSAAVPDQVPVRQRGLVSAFVGLPLSLSLITGTFVVSVIVTGRFPAYLTLGLAVLVLVLPFVLGPADRPQPRPRDTGGLRLHADLAWAFGCRFAVQLANAVGTLYLLYYLRDVVHRPDPARSVFLLILLYTAGWCPPACSPAGGRTGPAGASRSSSFPRSSSPRRCSCWGWAAPGPARCSPPGSWAPATASTSP
jgi:MFS family permease